MPSPDEDHACLDAAPLSNGSWAKVSSTETEKWTQCWSIISCWSDKTTKQRIQRRWSKAFALLMLVGWHWNLRRISWVLYIIMHYIYVLITVLETSQQQQLPTWLKIHQKYPKLKDQKQRLNININSCIIATNMQHKLPRGTPLSIVSGLHLIQVPGWHAAKTWPEGEQKATIWTIEECWNGIQLVLNKISPKTLGVALDL